jgi:hypothetical protein
MRVVGISLVKNAVRLEFPLLEALRSILPLCDHLIVNLGPSDDGTGGLLSSLGDERVEVIEGAWDGSLGGGMLAVETQRALDRADGDWVVYVQADEVLHEDGVEPLRAAMRAARDDRRVEGLLVGFRHLYGTPAFEGTGRQWYRREVRVVRPGVGVRSHGDAQGFRVGPSARRIRARLAAATYHHYGWARPAEALRAKREADNLLFYGGVPRRAPIGSRLPEGVGVRPFVGSHPAVMKEWLAARRGRWPDGFEPSPWSPRRAALILSLGIERTTGWRPFEFRNYVLV